MATNPIPWHPTSMSVEYRNFQYMGLPYGGFYLNGGKITPASYANSRYQNYLPLMYSWYGGDSQVTLVTPPLQYMPGCTFNGLAAQYTGTYAMPYGMSGGAPSINQNDIRESVRGNVEQAQNSMASENIQICLRGAKGLKSRIEAKIADTNTTEEQQATLNAILEEVTALITEANNLKSAGQDDNGTIEPKEAYQKSEEMMKKLTELQNKFKEATKAPEENTETGNTEGNEGTNNNGEGGN